MSERARPDTFERGSFARLERYGDEIHRTGQGGAAGEVVRLLRHFEAVGSPLTPRVLGVTAGGAVRLTYIEGDTGYPPLTDQIRSEECLVNVARAIRQIHDAGEDFVWEGPPIVQEVASASRVDCIGHHDLAPWNIVFQGSEVVGIIDWDTAGPSSRVWDLGYAAYQFVPFHPPAGMAAFGWTAEPDRRSRLELFVEAYGRGVTAEEVMDAAVLRVYGMGAHMSRRIARGDPAYARHAREDHASGYLEGAAHVAQLRREWTLSGRL